MIPLAEAIPDEQIVTTLSAQLSWCHFVELLMVKDPLAGDFYLEMCRIERWGVRTLRAKVGGMLFELTALSRKPKKLIREELDTLREQDRFTRDLVFRVPYILDFLGLDDTYSEPDLVQAILRELEAFILELGTDFSFVAHQKRLIIDGENYHLDLLFFHRGLRSLIAVELKLRRFEAADKGQVELYLRWLDRHERRRGGEAPLGLILCAGKGEQLVELLQVEASGIHVAEYLTELPAGEETAGGNRDSTIAAPTPTARGQRRGATASVNGFSAQSGGFSWTRDCPRSGTIGFMSKPKIEPTSFVQLHRAQPDPEPEPARPPAFGQPGFMPPLPEPLPRDAPVSQHLGRFQPDPATRGFRLDSIRGRRRAAVLLFIAVILLLVAMLVSLHIIG